MSINHVWDKIKGFQASLASFGREIALSAIIILVGAASYGLGRLSVLDMPREPIRLIQGGIAPSDQTAAVARSAQGTAPVAPQAPGKPQTGGYVASKTGSRYYPVDCAGASRLSEKNKITFTTWQEAEVRGYALGQGCKKQ